MKKNQTATTSAKRKIWLFKLIGILLPVILFVLLEVVLRLFSYGSNPDLFIEYPGNTDFLILNPEASNKFFNNQKNATRGNIELFRKQKGANTLRIFVLGESTTIGYPYFHNGSFHRWLQYRLMRSFPDRTFEIINLSLTAVNSYTVLSFAKELVDYSPDAVFIYTGHNEYYGALGVGSTEFVASNPVIVNLVIRLRQLRLTQLLTNLYQGVRNAFSKPGVNSGENRMKLMVQDQQIVFGSEKYKRGIEQFRSNIDETLAVLTRHQIPVFISNLVSNEKDLKPFVSFKVDSTKFPGFTKNYQLAIASKDSGTAYNYLRAAYEAYPEHALCNYYLGKMEYARGDFNKAKEFFSRAKDLDGLRFRAPGQINMVISELCKKYPAVHLVDAKSMFESYSKNNVIGNELILEHVHPNLPGYALLSDAFFKSIKTHQLVSVPAQSELSFQQLLQDMPITIVDSLAGVYKISRLKKTWPFNEALAADTIRVQSQVEQLAYDLAIGKTDWVKATNDLYNFYIGRHELEKARVVSENLVLEYPTEEQFYEKTAMLCGELKDYDRALFYFRKAFTMSPSFDRARFLFVINLQLDRPSDAIPYLDYAISENSSGMNLMPVKVYAQQVANLKAAYVKDSTNVDLLNRIGDLYLKMDNKEGALKYVNLMLNKDPKNKDALLMLSRLKK